MLKAIVLVTGQSPQPKEVEMHVINDVSQIEAYGKAYPVFYPIIKKQFKKDLAEGLTILVNYKGGYCHTLKGHFEIVKYL